MKTTTWLGYGLKFLLRQVIFLGALLVFLLGLVLMVREGFSLTGGVLMVASLVLFAKAGRR